MGDSLICAADTQISRGFTSSTATFKVSPLHGSWIALIAGNDLDHAERLMRSTMIGLDKFVTTYKRSPTPYRVYDILGDARKEAVNAVARESLPPAMTLEWFYEQGRDRLSPEVYATQFNDLAAIELQCELLVVGIGPTETAHLLTVGKEPPFLHDRLSFAAIGSGRAMALAILSAYDHDDGVGWQEAAYRVFAAKKTSERAAGVGPRTTIFRMDKQGMQWLNEELLDAAYERFGPLPPLSERKALTAEMASLTIQAEIKWDKDEFPVSDEPEFLGT